MRIEKEMKGYAHISASLPNSGPESTGRVGRGGWKEKQERRRKEKERWGLEKRVIKL